MARVARQRDQALCGQLLDLHPQRGKMHAAVDRQCGNTIGSGFLRQQRQPRLERQLRESTPASTRTIDGAWSITCGSAVADTLPARREFTHPRIRYKPWEAQPSRSPAITVAATACAWARLKPLCNRIDSANSRASIRLS
jgi:hypothetical protein